MRASYVVPLLAVIVPAVLFLLDQDSGRAPRTARDVGEDTARPGPVADAPAADSVPPPERTDAGGRFRIEHAKPGRYTVWLTEPGLVPTSAVVEVGTEGVSRVTLREGEGWSLRVRTVDAEGRPPPFQPLAVEQMKSGAACAMDGTGVPE
ncbi:MAG: hypothetical protein ACYTGU_17635 [Planctomycetota bacterium]